MHAVTSLQSACAQEGHRVAEQHLPGGLYVTAQLHTESAEAKQQFAAVSNVCREGGAAARHLVHAKKP